MLVIYGLLAITAAIGTYLTERVDRPLRRLDRQTNAGQAHAAQTH